MYAKIALVFIMTVTMLMADSPRQIVDNNQGNHGSLEVLLKLEESVVPLSAKTIGGLVELRNKSKEVITIVYRCDRREHLDFMIVDANGKSLSTKGYGRIFSPFEKKQTLLIMPGEKVGLGSIDLTVSFPESVRKAGQYTVVATFRFDKREYKSNPCPIKVVK